MAGVLRVIRLLTLVVWVGGLVFFAFVVAPVAFTVLPSAHIAGMVVAGTLGVLNLMGVACGVVFLLTTSLLWSRAARPRLLAAELWMVLAMLLATAYVQWRVVPQMERDRIAAGGNVDAAPRDNPARLDFERLHPVSEKVEGSALLLGLGVVVLVGLERSETLGATR